MGWLEDARRSGWLGDDVKKYQEQEDQKTKTFRPAQSTSDMIKEAMQRRMQQKAQPSPSPDPSPTE